MGFPLFRNIDPNIQEDEGKIAHPKTRLGPGSDSSSIGQAFFGTTEGQTWACNLLRTGAASEELGET
jgi:hypothetical protein